MFLNAKEFCQTPFNIRTLLIENEIKCSRPNRPPARSASGLAGGLANMVFSEFWISFRQKVSSQAPLHKYLGPQRIWGDMHFWGPNALKFSALSNNPGLVIVSHCGLQCDLQCCYSFQQCCSVPCCVHSRHHHHHQPHHQTHAIFLLYVGQLTIETGRNHSH